MLLDQRRESILEIVREKGFVSLVDLADAVGVSESTVRRDLEHLDRSGQVRRTRGGAAYVGESITGFDERRIRAAAEKQRIGRSAASLIEAGETVILDGGTTTLEVAQHLAGKSLQVVTNSLPIANVLMWVPEIELVFLGGYRSPKSGGALGAVAIAALRAVHARRLVMGVGGITADGLFNSNSLLVETERQMLEAADEVIVVADHGKFGHSELVRLCSLDRIQRMVVDCAVSEEWRRLMEQHGIELIVADEE